MKDIRVRELLVYLVCRMCPRRPSWKGMICDWCMAKTDGCVCLSVCLPAYLPGWLSVLCLSVCVCLCLSLSVCLCVCFFPPLLFRKFCARLNIVVMLAQHRLGLGETSYQACYAQKLIIRSDAVKGIMLKRVASCLGLCWQSDGLCIAVP